MAKPLHVRDVDHIGFQRREWTFERVGWLLFAAVIVLSLLGVFSSGVVSWTSSESPDGTVRVDYDRFLRKVGTSNLTITLGAGAVSNGKATVMVSRGLVDSWRIQNISPTPDTEMSNDRWVVYEFSTTGATAPVIEMLYRGDDVGPHDGVIQAGGDAARVWQLTYP